MKAYYVESNRSWFVVMARNAAEARREGTKEWGSRFVKSVREATEDEVTYFTIVKGSIGEAGC